jgi:hypothetical protein
MPVRFYKLGLGFSLFQRGMARNVGLDFGPMATELWPQRRPLRQNHSVFSENLSNFMIANDYRPSR